MSSARAAVAALEFSALFLAGFGILTLGTMILNVVSAVAGSLRPIDWFAWRNLVLTALSLAPAAIAVAWSVPRPHLVRLRPRVLIVAAITALLLGLLTQFAAMFVGMG